MTMAIALTGEQIAAKLMLAAEHLSEFKMKEASGCAYDLLDFDAIKDGELKTQLTAVRKRLVNVKDDDAEVIKNTCNLLASQILAMD